MLRLLASILLVVLFLSKYFSAQYKMFKQYTLDKSYSIKNDDVSYGYFFNDILLVKMDACRLHWALELINNRDEFENDFINQITKEDFFL